ncbi:hypothetical protein ACFLS1_05325 [Verrucomicrobiota bacterium]
MNIRNISLMALAFSIILLTPITNNASTSFRESKDTYNKMLGKIETDLDSQKETALTQYKNRLVKIKTMFQEQGDLDNLLPVMDEIKRFQAQQNIPNKPGMTSPIITKIQESYHNTVSESESAKQQLYLDLSRKWVKHLENLKTSLTKEGEFEEALKVKKEITGLTKKISVMESGLKADTDTVLTACPQCDGNGYTVPDCPRCKNTKKCSSCQGKGQVEGLRLVSKCVACRGTGDCRKCSADGGSHKKCSRCRGKKQIRVAAAPKPKPASKPDATAKPKAKPKYKPKPKPKSKPSSSSIQQGMDQYIKTMGQLFTSYKNQESQKTDFAIIAQNSANHIGKLYTSNVTLIHAFPRTVSIGFETKSEKIKTDLLPYSHNIGIMATDLFKKVGKAAQVQITYGIINEDNFTLFDIKSQ